LEPPRVTTARVKNWAEFQHYRDRSPPWIKLHRGLLDNLDYYLLTPEAAKCLPLLWLIASEDSGALPEAPRLAFRLRLSQTVVEAVISELMARGFLVAGDAEQGATPVQPKRSEWPSRHIPAPVRIEVWNRDGGRCVCCGSVENVEYDHKVPVSKGGESTAKNLQLLCRTCNRRKRQRLAVPGGLGMRSPEGEGEGEAKNKKPSAPRAASRFAEFWNLYPVKKGKKHAEASWRRQGLDAIADRIIADVVERKADDRQWREGFIPHGSTYVNGAGWEDAIDDTPPKAATLPNGRPEPVHNPGGTSPPVEDTPARRLAAMRAMYRQQVDLGVITEAAMTIKLRPYEEAARAASPDR
jgi:hypothetical protein